MTINRGRLPVHLNALDELTLVSAVPDTLIQYSLNCPCSFYIYLADTEKKSARPVH